MYPTDQIGEPRKPIRPFLRKGEGTARFGMQNLKRKSQGTIENSSAPMAESPTISLPRFTPSSMPPTSARTMDSGYSNEDDTRPPTTTSSLPPDRPSPSENSEFPRHRTPIVVEEEEAEAEDRAENDAEEEVSAFPEEFVPDEGVSSIIQNSDDVGEKGGEEEEGEKSEDAIRMRERALGMMEEANMIRSMKSVSTTPSSYSANFSGPLGASTPKNMEEPNFETSNEHPPSNNGFPPISLDTPQGRPFNTNRANLMAQNEAQTGISLLQNNRRLQQQNQQNHQNIKNPERQKENIQNQNHHVYDEPILPRHHHHHQLQNIQNSQKIQTKPHPKVLNLMKQLRDSIAHLDFAEEKVRSAGRRVVEESRILRENYEQRKMTLETEFSEKVRTILEENRQEEERLQREKREIERDRKILNKGIGERHKELTETISNLREKINRGETANAKLRQEIRNRDEKLKKKEEEMEKLTKDLNRYKKNSETLEKRIKQMRNEKEKEERERELFERMAISRKNQTGREPPANSASTVSSARNPSTSTISNFSKKSNLSAKTRSVSWADEPEEQSLEVMDNSELFFMKPSGTENHRFGKSTIYRNSLGDATKMTKTGGNGILFEYSNGDFRWMTRQNWVNIYRYKDGTIFIDLAYANIYFVYVLQRQLEVHRPDNNKTLISVNRKDIRTELIRQNDGNFVTEIFDREGRYVTKDFVHREVVKEIPLGSPCSIRGADSSRHVICQTPLDFELIEPEFRFRWSKGEWIVFKLFGRTPNLEKTLRIQINAKTGEGTMNEVTSATQQSTVFEWPV